jgi:CheY-like chemotaxis protein
MEVKQYTNRSGRVANDNKMKTRKFALVVDDNSTWREIFRNLLVDTGYTVETAATLEDAKNVLFHNQVTIAILDLSLDRNNQNNRDGLVLCSFIRKEKLLTQVILVTGTVSLQDIKLDDYVGTVAWLCEKTKFDRFPFREKIEEIEQSIQKNFTAAEASKLEFIKQSHKGYALVLEDSDDWQSILKEALEAEGFASTLLKDYASALGEIRRKSYDIVTVDLKLKSSEDMDENRYGRVLIPELHELGIPIIVVSAYLKLDEVLEDYQQFKNIVIIDKAAFSIRYFRNCVREMTAQPLRHKAKTVTDTMIYRVVQTFLRNYYKLDRDFVKRAEIIEISQKLGENVDVFVRRIRDDIDQIIDSQIKHAVADETKKLKVEGFEFTKPEEFVDLLMQSLNETKVDPKNEGIWPLLTKHMKEFLVLEALYRRGLEYEKTALVLKNRLAVEDGALNTIRRRAITEIASILRSNWRL